MNVAVHPDSAGRCHALRYLSLCTGGGGLDLGVELAIPGARPVCLVEREAFAAAHLVAAIEDGLMAPAPVWSDARTFDGRPWRGLVDGLVGGIPCQPHSAAGQKLGSQDERDLWSPARRIIVQSRVWFVLIENVSGMLTPPKSKEGADEIAGGLMSGGERVWRDLQRLGFLVEGGLFTAEEVGAPHERARLFILAISDQRAGDFDRFAVSNACRGGHARRAQEPERGPGRRTAAEWNCAELANGDIEGLETAGRPAGPNRSGQPADGGQCLADGTGLDGRLHARPGQPGQSAPDAGRDGAAVGDADGKAQPARRREPGEPGWRGRLPGERCGGIPLFPPGPADRDGWAAIARTAPELEPAVCRVADGLATELDHTGVDGGIGPFVGRVDRLRLLGNGVVPLAAGYAVRTLLARLAARGSAAAKELAVRAAGAKAA